MSDDRWKVSSATPREPQTRLEVPAGTPWWKAAQAAPFAPLASWWNESEHPTFGNHYDTSPSQWIGIPLFKAALEGGPPVQLCGWEGNLVVPGKSLLEAIPKVLSCRLVRLQDRGNSNGAFIFASESIMVSVSFMEQGRYASIQVATDDPDLIRKAAQLFDRCLQPDDPRKGLVFTLARTMGGYTLSRLGVAGTPLERGNYTPEVLKSYDHVVTDLNTEAPCGRLIILSGTPGTGKTFLVRSLLAQAPKAAYVLVPAHLVENLSGPEMLPALTSAKNEFNGPIVLIIEDADKVLVNRKDGDMNAISAMLNLGDGILGAVLDIRILATTNAEKLEMDPATRRKGRLCRYIEVGPLPADLASKALHRLTGKIKDFSGPMTIADVYSEARDLGWKPPQVVPPRPEMRAEIL